MRLLIALAFALLASQSHAQSYSKYAEQCAAIIGEIPEFSCADGVMIPITVNGAPPREYTKGMTCDRPALLPNGEDSDGQCVPGSRIVNLSRTDAQISVMCRQKHIRALDSLDYDEIDVIAHDPVSGATCWFQASAPKGGVLNGADVPSPTSKEGEDFYNPLTKVLDEDCGGCHDNDPFMYSPFVGQVWGHVPTNPFGPYYQIDPEQAGFDQWPTTQIQPRDSTCTGCHRIGIQETCGLLTQWATGQQIPPGSDDLARGYPLSHAMPPYHGQTMASWSVINDPAVAEIATCCGNHDLAQCNATEIERYLK